MLGISLTRSSDDIDPGLLLPLRRSTALLPGEVLSGSSRTQAECASPSASLANHVVDFPRHMPFVVLDRCRLRKFELACYLSDRRHGHTDEPENESTKVEGNNAILQIVFSSTDL